MLKSYLDFEKPIQELELQIDEMKRLGNDQDQEVESEIENLTLRADALSKEIFSKLTPWQKTQVARHPDRPYTLDYISLLTDDYIELHGDRKFSDDPAIVGGIGSIAGTGIFIIGHQKGRGTKERIRRNFGQPNPEGYRKALRLMQLAERYKKPLLFLIDTPGAFPGIGAEERGQSEAIATNLQVMSRLKVPIISIVIGEGGSGGALGLSVADRLYMLQHSVYSVISPEGCAAILWKKKEKLDADDFLKAAESLRITPEDLLSFEIIDGIIPEPAGGAHRDAESAAENIREALLRALDELKKKNTEDLLDERYSKIRRIGRLSETGQATAG